MHSSKLVQSIDLLPIDPLSSEIDVGFEGCTRSQLFQTIAILLSKVCGGTQVTARVEGPKQ